MASSVNRLVGRYAVCAVTNLPGNILLNLIDWQVRLRTEFVDGTGFGDFWDVPVPIKYLWNGRARGFYSSLNSYLSAYSAVQAGTADILAVTFIGYVDDSLTQKIFQAPGFVEASAFMAPQAMVEQELEIRGVGNPTLIT